MADMALADLIQCAATGVICVIEHPARSGHFQFPVTGRLFGYIIILFTRLYQQDYGATGTIKWDWFIPFQPYMRVSITRGNRGTRARQCPTDPPASRRLDLRRDD